MMATWLPLIGIVVFLSVVGCWRPWLQWRRYGSAGVLFLRSASWRQNLRDALGIVLAMGLVGQAIAAAGWPASLSPIGVLSQPEARIWQVTGAVVLFHDITQLKQTDKVRRAFVAIQFAGTHRREAGVAG